MSIKSIKEKQLLVNLAKSFGQEVDPAIVKEVNEHKQFEDNIKQSIRSNILFDLNKALVELKQQVDVVSIENNFPMPPSLEDLDKFLMENEEIVDDLDKEETKEIPVEISTLTELASEAISASVKRESFNQPDPPLVDSDIGDIQRKIKFLEQWIGKISLMGPGGGASDTSNFTSFTKLVTGSYTIARKDYYVGVNHSDPVTITLPSSAENGHTLVIKDESGNCKHNPITIAGTIDNDPNGILLKINNGAIQLIYRNGWRII